MSTQPPPQVPYPASPAGANPYAAAPPVDGNPYAAGPTAYAAAPAQFPGAPGEFPAGPPMPGQFPGAPDPMAHGGLSCRFCGSVPAVQATIRGHQGFLVIMRFLKLEGPFCRNCGIATHRRMTAKSLWQGWWGIASALVNPITMLVNLPQRAKINKLPPPVPGAPGQPADPGRPLFLRPAILGLLIPVIAVGFLVFQAKSDPSYASVGDCVHNKNAIAPGAQDSNPDVTVLPCSDPSADAKIVGKEPGSTDGDTVCQKYSDADGYYTQQQGSDRFTLCLHFLK